MYSAIIGSKRFNATLVLPQWNIGDPNNVQLVETSHLWDTATLLEHAAEEGVSVMFPTVADHSRMCSSKPSGIRPESRLPAFAAGEYDTMCVGGSDLFTDLWKQDLTEDEVQSQGFLVSQKIFLGGGRCCCKEVAPAYLADHQESSTHYRDPTHLERALLCSSHTHRG